MAVQAAGERLTGAAAGRALRALGLSVELLREVLLAGELAANAAGPYHPTIASGLVRWADTVALLHQRLAALGWRRHEEHLVPQVTSPDGRITVSVMSGNGLTGLDDDVGPQPRSARARNVPVIDEVSGQLAFFDAAEAEAARVGPELWLLLYQRQSGAPARIRAELSRPIGLSETGHVESWDRRILLPPIELGVAAAPADGVKMSG